MYEAHFGFTGSPFQLNPDPAFYFDSRGHSNALAYLKFGAHQGEGFIVVTGEIGAGKTTLVRTLLEGLNPDQVVAAQVVSTQLESSELLQAILMAFGVPSSSTSKAHLIANLEGFLTALAAKGRRALLIIDEAQNLRHEAVEELRMLSNFQLGKYGLLQSFLVGQPELRGLLQSKSMEQLRQRVIASCHLGPLDPPETRAYVEHRLKRVGWKNTSPAFGADALDRVYHWTGGVPRKINRLCNRVLLGAFLANANTVTFAMIDESALELRSEIGEALVDKPPFEPAGEPAAPVPVVAPQPAAPQAQAASAVPPAGTGAAPAPAAHAPPTPVLQPAHSPAASIGGGWGKAPALPQTPLHADAPVRLARAAAESGVGEALLALPLKPARQPVRRAHQKGPWSQPLVCLVDSTAEYLMTGVLADVFQGFPSLPRVVALHSGAEADLGIAGLESLELPMPAMGIHLGITPKRFARAAAETLSEVEALFDEMQPSALLILGNSDAALVTGLLARKLGVPVIRCGSGRREALQHSEREMRSSLLEKTADIHYADSTESFYELYRDGIRLDRVYSVGNLARETAALLRTRFKSAPTPESTLPGAGAQMRLADYGVINIDPIKFLSDSAQRSAAIRKLSQWSESLPLIWLTGVDGLRSLTVADVSRCLDGPRFAAIACEGLRPGLDWLLDAKCLVCEDDSVWLREARSIGLPSLLVDRDLNRLSAMQPVDGVQIGVGEAPPDRNWALRVLHEQATLPRPPDYWDTGTATRIATQLIMFLSTRATSVASAEGDHATLSR